MQYSQLKQVIHLDDQITTLHKELSDLYAERAKYVDSSTLWQQAVRSSKKAKPASDPWVVQTYSYLTNAWLAHGIAIPDLSELETKLLKARRVIDHLRAGEPSLANDMGILLVPPSSILPFPVPEALRRQQSHITLNDYVASELTVSPSKKGWQVLAVYLGPVGLDVGGAAKIMKHKKFMLGQHDTRALGVRQYAALTLQVNHIVDQNVWTVLLGEKVGRNGLIVSVTYLPGQYRFELDEPNSALGEERFRPAVEIKG